MGKNLSETTVKEIRGEALELHYLLEDYQFKKQLLNEVQNNLADILQALDNLGYRENVLEEVEKIKSEIPF